MNIFQAVACRFSPAFRNAMMKEALHQKNILRVMTVLPGKYQYEQIEAAINASGVIPMDIYESLAANKNTFALARFYEFLNG